jgi:hypothetical protein
MHKLLSPLLLSLLSCLPAAAQFAPQAGVTGSDAIHKSSGSIKAWASGCTVTRGLQDIGNPSLGYAAAGDEMWVPGPADGGIVSLGDSGIAVVSFAQVIYNGPGPDFAVFENGFANPSNPEEAFLELAFVEVSSDGEHYFRFPAQSNTPLSTQIPGTGVYMNARLVNNLAGKYVSCYGTPFDLEELKGTSGLDVDHITHVRIVDVIGAIHDHSSLDINGQVINDPYPTNFATGGFDLDAVAVLNAGATGIDHISQSAPFKVFPNPTADFVQVQPPAPGNYNIKLTDLSGRTMLQVQTTAATQLNLGTLPQGMYYISISNETGATWTGKLSRL